jgi:hypothetical protein
MQFAICNLQFSIFDFYLISLLRPFSTRLSNTAQNTALLSNFTMLLAYCTIACTLAMQPCLTALPDSLARQSCPAVLPGSLAEKFASCFTAVGRHACMQYCILLLGRAGSLVQAFPAIKDIAILSLVYYRLVNAGND